ncbi:MAG: nucleotidyltransferase domain-containing protein [Candidatus Omnitrophota bacterium]
MIDISERDLLIIKHILRKHVPDCEVRVFGSRITSKTKKYSDLDLVIIGREKLARRVKMLIKEAFEESELSFRVDVLDWYALSESFKKVITEEYEVIQNPV